MNAGIKDEPPLSSALSGAGEMAQQVKVLAAKSDNLDLSFISGTHMVEELTPESCPLTSTHVLWHTHTCTMCTHTYTHTIMKKKKAFLHGV